MVHLLPAAVTAEDAAVEATLYRTSLWVMVVLSNPAGLVVAVAVAVAQDQRTRASDFVSKLGLLFASLDYPGSVKWQHLTSTWRIDALQMLPPLQGCLTKNRVETFIGAQTKDDRKTVVYEAGIMA